jgi:hypothetical protein
MDDAKQRQEPLRFSDFAEPDDYLDGSKMKVEDVLNRALLVRDFRIAPSKYKQSNSEDYLTIQFEFTDKPDVRYVLMTGSTVLMKTLEQYKDKLPFITTIRKVDRFYKFT